MGESGREGGREKEVYVTESNKHSQSHDVVT